MDVCLGSVVDEKELDCVGEKTTLATVEVILEVDDELEDTKEDDDDEMVEEVVVVDEKKARDEEIELSNKLEFVSDKEVFINYLLLPFNNGLNFIYHILFFDKIQ